jgi:hypothetical protein
MAKFSMKKDGKEVGSASVYAEPHTMTGKSVSNTVPEETGTEYMNKMNVSVASVSKGNYPETKTSGIEMRGAGAATKGRMSRGPMA